jgi:hypothetical protein
MAFLLAATLANSPPPNPSLGGWEAQSTDVCNPLLNQTTHTGRGMVTYGAIMEATQGSGCSWMRYGDLALGNEAHGFQWESSEVVVALQISFILSCLRCQNFRATKNITEFHSSPWSTSPRAAFSLQSCKILQSYPCFSHTLTLLLTFLHIYETREYPWMPYRFDANVPYIKRNGPCNISCNNHCVPSNSLWAIEPMYEWDPWQKSSLQNRGPNTDMKVYNINISLKDLNHKKCVYWCLDWTNIIGILFCCITWLQFAQWDTKECNCLLDRLTVRPCHSLLTNSLPTKWHRETRMAGLAAGHVQLTGLLVTSHKNNNVSRSG